MSDCACLNGNWSALSGAEQQGLSGGGDGSDRAEQSCSCASGGRKAAKLGGEPVVAQFDGGIGGGERRAVGGIDSRAVGAKKPSVTIHLQERPVGAADFDVDTDGFGRSAGMENERNNC